MEISGIDAEYIVSNLLQIEQRPLLALQARQNTAKLAADALARLKTSVDAFRGAAAKLADIASFNRYATSVSHSDVVAASVSGTAVAGTLTFTVDRLAQAHGLRSVGTVASSSVAITTASHIAVAAGTGKLGVATVSAGAGLEAGSVKLEVVQASSAASVAGTTALATSTIVDGSNDTLEITVNGVARTVTLAHGTYDRAGLAAAVQGGVNASGGGASATVTASGAIAIATHREGSSATLEVTGGSALASLQLAVSGSPQAGVDAVVEVGGNQTVVGLAQAGQAVAVDTGNGTLDITLSGGLRVGSVDVKVVSTGDRSLAAVAAAITSANAGVTAAAVDTGAGGWRLQLTAKATGAAGQIAIDPAAFDAVGGLIETSAAQNAQITIGSGPGAYQIEASGNTFTNVLGGVTLTAKAASTTPVTVSVARNDDAAAADIGALVSAANTLLAEIKVQTRYDAATRTSGALAGNGAVRQLADQIRQALGAPVGGMASSLPSRVGIQIGKDGSFSFDKATFMAAAAEDPDVVARLFSRSGTDSGDAVFAAAAAETAAGSYDVVVTTAATRASTGTLFDGGASSNARIGVRVGSLTALVDVTAGQSAGEIAGSLNAAFAQAGLGVVAEVDGGGLRIRAQQWGAAGDFELNDDVLGAGDWVAQQGTDVAGTIDGVLAVGTGRRLSLLALADSPAAGLAIDVAEGATGALGQVEYRPGIAARIVEVATRITRSDKGTLTSAVDAAGKRVADFNDQITRFEDRLVVKEATLRRQWANVQTLLGSLQNQQQWITGQLAGLSNNWASSSK